MSKAIAYILNPEKTDEKLLVSSYGCASETAAREFEWTRKIAEQKGMNPVRIIARHVIQSFEIGEVTPELAHEIGKQFADETLGGKYEYVLTTHIDKDHVHNHLIFNAVDFSVYRRTNIVKSEKFSEIIQSAMNRYLNGMLTNEEVIQELLKLAKDIAAAAAEGEKLGLTADELAFYDALTKPQAIKDFYEHDELIAITKELTDLLRKNQTIDWQKKESARAGMRRLVKRLLKKHKYPPEGMDDAVQTVMSQCEMWTDNVMTA